jgi:hypothetical protein
MDGLDQTVGQGLGNIAAALGDLGGGMVRLFVGAGISVDVGLHHFIPWYIPTWLLAGVAVTIVALFLARR